MSGKRSSRIEEKFKTLSARGDKALITYIMAGDPDINETERLVLDMEKAGADIIELGVPFSDPLADGPTIQKAAIRALKHDVSIGDVIHLVARIRKVSRIPIALMTYYNPVFRYGEERFVRDAVKAGVDGIIIPDLPPEEADTLIISAREKGLDTIFLLAPTSDERRIKRICRDSKGFIYYVSLTGVTGERTSIAADMNHMVKKIRKSARIPVAAGFGISSPEQAGKASETADGIIVGSAIVRLIEENMRNRDMRRKVGEFVKSLNVAVKSAGHAGG